MRTGSITLTIDSRLEEVYLVSKAVRGICEEARLGEIEAYQVETCVVEAVNNAIEHAYESAGGQQVTVTVSVDGDHLVVHVYDNGRCMSPVPGEFPDVDSCGAENLPERGWGWGIMRAWMDGVSYAAGEDGNVLRLVKHLPATAKTAR